MTNRGENVKINSVMTLLAINGAIATDISSKVISPIPQAT